MKIALILELPDNDDTVALKDSGDLALALIHAADKLAGNLDDTHTGQAVYDVLVGWAKDYFLFPGNRDDAKSICSMCSALLACVDDDAEVTGENFYDYLWELVNKHAIAFPGNDLEPNVNGRSLDDLMGAYAILPDSLNPVDPAILTRLFHDLTR